ncbi:MAG: transcription termination/antitermination NusG family protein [Sedimentisphaerales bacterium]
MLKISENPPLMWPHVESLRHFTGEWWVVHTKSRNEKALAHDLVRREISYFLPMSWKVRRKSRRTIRSLLPLFSGYLFFCGGENERTEVLRTDRVANLIKVNDQERLLNELLQIQQALVVGAPLVPDKYVKAGQKCKVMAGPLLGLEGVVVTTRGATRLVLQVDMLGQAASVEIDIDTIEVVE